METISLDLRTRIMLDSDSGMTDSDVAAKHIVSVAFVKKLKSQRRRTGSIAPIERKLDSQRRKLSGCEDDLRRLIDSGEARTLEELRQKLRVRVSLFTIWREVHRLGYRYKKRHLLPQSKGEKTWLENATTGFAVGVAGMRKSLFFSMKHGPRRI